MPRILVTVPVYGQIEYTHACYFDFPQRKQTTRINTREDIRISRVSQVIIGSLYRAHT